MQTFFWGFEDEAVADPRLAVAQALIEADRAVGDDASQEELAEDDSRDAEDDWEDEEPPLDDYVEEPLPPFYDKFRRSARINTYTVIGPGLHLDDYPFYTPQPQGYPTIFGPNSDRTRTLAGE